MNQSVNIAPSDLIPNIGLAGIEPGTKPGVEDGASGFGEMLKGFIAQNNGEQTAANSSQAPENRVGSDLKVMASNDSQRLVPKESPEQNFAGDVTHV